MVCMLQQAILGAWARVGVAPGGLFNSTCKMAAEVRTFACVKSFQAYNAYTSGSGMPTRPM
jgi:hypothetical protein